MRKFIFLFFGFIFIHIIAIAQTGKEFIKVTDMLKIRSISGVTLSKDGNKAAFTVNNIEPDGDNKWDYKYVNHIYIISTGDSASLKEFTVKESSSQPAWSSDGRQLAFVRVADGKPQIFL